MLNEIASIPVRDIRSKDAMSVTADVPIRETIRRMAEHRCGAVLIVDAAGRLTGIFTERDVLLRSLDGGPAWQDRPVGEVMTRSPVAVHEEDTLEEALLRMRGGHFRHLPVVADDRPIGVVSIRDVLAYVASHFPKDFVNLPPVPSRPSVNRWGG